MQTQPTQCNTLAGTHWPRKNKYLKSSYHVTGEAGPAGLHCVPCIPDGQWKTPVWLHLVVLSGFSLSSLTELSAKVTIAMPDQQN